MKFVLLESKVSSINREAKKQMKRQAAANPHFGIEPETFDHCLRHHIGGSSDYETNTQVMSGILNPSIIIPSIEDNDFNQNVIHSIIEHYSGKNVLDLIKYIFKICNLTVIYHCSNTGTPEFRQVKLHKLISELNK